MIITASWYLLVLLNLYWASPLVNQSSVDRGETLVFKDPQQAPFFSVLWPQPLLIIWCFHYLLHLDLFIFLSFKRDAFFFCRKIIWMFIALTHGVVHYFQRTTLDSRFAVIIFHTLHFLWSSCLSCKGKQKHVKDCG